MEVPALLGCNPSECPHRYTQSSPETVLGKWKSLRNETNSSALSSPSANSRLS